MKVLHKLGSFVWVSLFTILLLIPCFYNNFPLVTSNSGTYISSGLQGYLPWDRPIFYGLFVGLLSFKYSLWIPIIAQSFMLAFLLYKLYTYLLPNTSKYTYFLITLCICTTTSLAWFASQIMSDIFVGIGFLALMLLLNKKTNKIELVLFAIFYFIAINTHNSHLLIFTLFVISFTILYWVNLFSLKNSTSKKRVYFVLIFTILTWLSNPTINYFYDGKFKHSGSPYAFLTAKYAENGILKQYLNDKCNTKAKSKYLESGTYFFVNKASNMVLDVEAYSVLAGAKIHQWAYLGNDNQIFTIEKQNKQFIKLKSKISGKYITVSNDEWGNLVLKQEDPTQNDNQLFQLELNDEVNIVNVKIVNKNAYLASDTSNRNLGMLFLTASNPKLNLAKFELINTANCFCYFKDSIPNNAMTFIWGNRSIFSRTGNWEDHEKRYKPVILDILFSNDYFLRNVKAALKATFTQLAHNDIGDGLFAFDTKSSPYYNLTINIPNDKQSFLESQQSKGYFNFMFLNFIIQKVMKISFWVVLIIILSPLNLRLKPTLLNFTLLMFLLLVINAFVTGAMANILDRLQSRISWILPLTAILLIFSIVDSYQDKTHQAKKMLDTD